MIVKWGCFQSKHPRLHRFLTSWFLMLVGSQVGYVVHCIGVGGSPCSIKVYGIVELGLNVVFVLAVLPYMSAIFGPLAASCWIDSVILRQPAGSPFAVTLIMTMSGLFYVLLVCSCRNAFANRWPWLRWVWRVCLVALSAVGMYALIVIGGQ